MRKLDGRSHSLGLELVFREIVLLQSMENSDMTTLEDLANLTASESESQSELNRWWWSWASATAALAAEGCVSSTGLGVPGELPSLKYCSRSCKFPLKSQLSMID
jgi:hypothetical protein